MHEHRAPERPASAALDEYLVIECQLGNVDAFRALFRRWHGRLLGRARELTGDREAALDVTQESWIGIARGIHQLRDPAHFGAWSLRIVTNKARDWIRRERSRRRVMEEVAGEPPHTASPGEPDPEAQRVRACLRALDAAKRAVLRRHYVDGRSVAEIASELGIPEGTVKSRLHTARHELKRRLEED